MQHMCIPNPAVKVIGLPVASIPVIRKGTSSFPSGWLLAMMKMD